MRRDVHVLIDVNPLEWVSVEEGLKGCGFDGVTVNVEEEGGRQGVDANVRHGKDGQLVRRGVIAKARNKLLRLGLEGTNGGGEGMVVWVDSDLDVVRGGTVGRLWDVMEEEGADVVVPRCVNKDGRGVYDLNSWRETEESRKRGEEMGARGEVMFEGYGETGRLHMDDLAEFGRGKYGVVDLDGVGGTFIVARRKVFEAGAKFPEVVYRGAVETEGFGLMAGDMGFKVVGAVKVVVTHA